MLYSVATPKRIREIMQEDGLTNDEVKSHLQVRTLHNILITCSFTRSSIIHRIFLPSKIVVIFMTLTYKPSSLTSPI